MRSRDSSIPRPGRLLIGLAAAVSVGLVVVAGTARTTGAAPRALPAGTPDLSRIALAPADLRGAKVARQGSIKRADALASYHREFKAGFAVGRVKALTFENDILYFASPAKAQTYYRSVKAVLGSKLGRAGFTKTVAADFANESTTVTYGRLRTLPVGNETFVQPYTAGVLQSQQFPFAATLTRRDRMISWLFVMGDVGRPIATADLARLQRVVTGRIVRALTPGNSAPPAVTGTAVPGETLTGSDGTWTNAPTRFTRSWQRCDSTGAGCAPIAGATTQTYTVTPKDGGFRIRYSVVAGNALGTSTAAVSAPTATIVVVQPPFVPPPPN